MRCCSKDLLGRDQDKTQNTQFWNQDIELSVQDNMLVMMIVFIKAINRQTAVNTMQNILTC